MNFLSPALLKLKAEVERKEMVIINSLPPPHSRINHILWIRRHIRDREKKSLCVYTHAHTYIYMVTTGFSLLKLFALRLEHSDPGKMMQLISGKK